MPFDGNGTYTAPATSRAVTGAVIDSVKFNALLDDLNTALSLMLCRDGQSAMLANMQTGGYNWLGLTMSNIVGTLAQFNTSCTDANFASLAGAESLTNKTYVGVKEVKSALAANEIDVTVAGVYTKTITGTTTFTVAGTAATGTLVSFLLELTNAGAHTVNWWSGMKWENGVAPTLTISGVDILGFYTHDGGTTWRGVVLARDSK